MSTIKSSDEHLTLNADGSGKSVKFQANGVEKASISSSGAFTSTTIDATKLTGDLPAISGANLTGVGVSGISSSADATAMTIDSGERIGIGVTPESWDSSTKVLQLGSLQALSEDNSGYGALTCNAYASSGWKRINTGAAIRQDLDKDGKFVFRVAPSGSADAAISWTNALEITNDGRGLSQFTAKMWINFDGTDHSIRDSHNVSSISDISVGKTTIYFTNNMSNTNFYVGGSAVWRNAMCCNGFGTNFVQVITGVFGGADAGADDCSIVQVSVMGD